jgi:hypothetical protein
MHLNTAMYRVPIVIKRLVYRFKTAFFVLHGHLTLSVISVINFFYFYNKKTILFLFLQIK